MTLLSCNKPSFPVFPAKLAPLVEVGVDIDVDVGRIVFPRVVDRAVPLEADPETDDKEADAAEDLEDTEDERALDKDDNDELPDDDDADEAEEAEEAEE